MAARRKLRPVTLEEQLERASAAPSIAHFRQGAQLELPEIGPRLTPLSSVPPRRPPTGHRVPYDVALRQITKTVISALDEFGEQWGCDARKSLVCTLFIAAVKDKRIAFDFDQEAA